MAVVCTGVHCHVTVRLRAFRSRSITRVRGATVGRLQRATELPVTAPIVHHGCYRRSHTARLYGRLPPSGDSFYGRRWQVMEAGGPVRAGRVGGVNKVKFAFVCAENAPVCAPLKSRTRRVNGACTGRVIPVTIRAACVCYTNE